MVVGDFAREAKLVVIGAGPAGCAAALRAAALGLEPLVIDPPGAPQIVAGHVLEGAEMGLLRRKLGEAGVEVLTGRPRFESDRDLVGVEATLPRIRFRRAIVTSAGGPPARGAVWPASLRIVDAPAPAGATGSQTGRIPESVLIVGGDAAAVVLAGSYARMGSRVTLAAPTDRLLPAADPELLAPLLAQLQLTLDHVLLESAVSGATDSGSTVEVAFGSGSTRRRFDLVVLAPPEQPDLGSLELKRAGVELDATGAIRVDRRQATSNPHIFAAPGSGPGTVLWHASWRQGEVAADGAAGKQTTFDAAVLPQIVRCDPPIAWCGLTEGAANAGGTEHVVGQAKRGVPAPAGSGGGAGGSSGGGGGGEPPAVARIIADPASHLVLGVGLAGSGAAEVIGEAVLAIEMGAVAEDLAGSLRSDTLLSALLTAAAAALEE